MPSPAANIAIVLGCSVYRAWLLWKVFLVLMAFIAIGALCYRLLVSRAFRVFKHGRDKEDQMFGHFQAVIEGIRVETSSAWREALLSGNLQPTVDGVRH